MRRDTSRYLFNFVKAFSAIKGFSEGATDVLQRGLLPRCRHALLPYPRGRLTAEHCKQISAAGSPRDAALKDKCSAAGVPSLGRCTHKDESGPFRVRNSSNMNHVNSTSTTYHTICAVTHVNIYHSMKSQRSCQLPHLHPEAKVTSVRKRIATVSEQSVAWPPNFNKVM